MITVLRRRDYVPELVPPLVADVGPRGGQAPEAEKLYRQTVTDYNLVLDWTDTDEKRTDKWPLEGE